MASGGGDNRFIYSAVVFAVAVLFLTPTMVNMYASPDNDVGDSTLDGLLSDYTNFTGSQSNLANEDVWTLSGIYTPYLGGSYHYEPNGWLYGSKIGVSSPYLPSQYTDTSMANCTVQYDENMNVYKYTTSSFDGHDTGDIYSAVTMDVNQKSDIFFTTSGKNTSGNYFWYEYSGYRYEFSPSSQTEIYDANGDIISIDSSNAGLSLIWYDYLSGTASGLSGQLILSTDQGVAFLTSEDILRAYESAISTAKFEMVFNGVPINIYIRINPYYISQGMSIEDCWNNGYWEVMVSTNSVETSDYLSSDYSFNIYQIWDTFQDLFTFNTAEYGFDEPYGTIASLLMCIPMYALLISVGLTCYPVLIVAGIVAGVQAIATAITHWDWGGWL